MTKHSIFVLHNQTVFCHNFYYSTHLYQMARRGSKKVIIIIKLGFTKFNGNYLPADCVYNSEHSHTEYFKQPVDNEERHYCSGACHDFDNAL